MTQDQISMQQTAGSHFAAARPGISVPAAPGGARSRLDSLLFGSHAGDRPQRLRMLRYLIASGSSLLVICLFGVGWLLGFVPFHALVVASALVAAFIVLFFVVFRTA